MRPKAKARTLDNSVRLQATGAGMSAKEIQATVSTNGMLALIRMIAIARMPARAVIPAKAVIPIIAGTLRTEGTKWQRISF